MVPVKKVRAGARRSSAKARPAVENVAHYLDGVPESARSTFDKLRAAVRSSVPRDATEIISYQILAFKKDEVLVWFAAFSKHCSLFPSAAVIKAFKDELKGYTTSKGTIRFRTDQPLPITLIKKIVRARVEQSKAGKRR
jgi:uncharacterized protein YdhG (YjbR/CyaY superfamily)